MQDDVLKVEKICFKQGYAGDIRKVLYSFVTRLLMARGDPIVTSGRFLVCIEAYNNTLGKFAWRLSDGKS